MKAFKLVTLIVVLPLLCFLIGASALVFWPRDLPFGGNAADPETWQTREISKGGSVSFDVAFSEMAFEARDGANLYARMYGNGETDTLIVFLHGLASDSSRLNNAAGLLAQSTGASVVTPDARGHGLSDGKRTDVDHVGQYEEDLEDIMLALIAERPGRRIVISGHAMGGGVALRYALLEKAPRPAAWLLFAPSLGDTPTLRREPDPEVDAALLTGDYIFFDGARFIGLLLFNTIGIHGFDEQKVLYFNNPPDFPAYSFRSVLAGTPNRPRNAAVALRAAHEPLLVLVGERDEPFIAAEYEPYVSANSDGQTIMIPELTHNGLINSPITFEEVSRWFDTL